MSKASSAIPLILCFVLAACASKPEPPAAAPPAPMSARDLAASRVHADPVAAAKLISQYREDHGLTAVTPDPALQKLAQAQADAMAARNLLSHDIDGTLTQRFDKADLSEATAVENVSAGYFSLANVMNGWEASPLHKANLLSPSMRRLGIATAFAPGTRYEVFWALDMSN